MEQLSKDLLNVINLISFGNPIIVGSSADYRVLYYADYDLMEEIPLQKRMVRIFQSKIKKIKQKLKITDIKIGEITEWNLLKKPYIENSKVHKYDQAKELQHLSSLWSSELITHDEFMLAEKLLKPHLTSVEFLQARKELRFGILRWTTEEIQKGYKEYRKHIIYLYDAFKTKAITKIDVIAWVHEKYTEFSNIILWTKNGKPYANIPSLKKSLKENVLEYEADENYVKVGKRMLSLAKAYKDSDIQEKLTNIFNSPIGKLYTVVADLEIIEEFPKAVKARKRKQLDLMKDSFRKLYFPQLKNSIPNLKLLPEFRNVLQEEMKKALEKHKLLPVPRDYVI